MVVAVGGRSDSFIAADIGVPAMPSQASTLGKWPTSFTCCDGRLGGRRIHSPSCTRLCTRIGSSPSPSVEVGPTPERCAPCANRPSTPRRVGPMVHVLGNGRPQRWHPLPPQRPPMPADCGQGNPTTTTARSAHAPCPRCAVSPRRDWGPRRNSPFAAVLARHR